MTPFQKKQLVLMRQMEASALSGQSASTIVPMQSDFIQDPQIALTCITYIPNQVAQTIQTQLIEPLRAVEPAFYYYPVEAMHITIQNVRIIHEPPNFSASDIAKVQSMLEQTVPKFGPFTFKLSGLLSMPTSISLIALIQPEYDHFVRLLRQNLVNIHVPDDKTYFTDEIVFGNTTICRYTHTPKPKFLETLQTLKDKTIGTVVANSVSLVEMNAGAHPSKTRVLGVYRFR